MDLVEKECRIEVIDSQTVAMGMGLIVIEAAKAAAALLAPMPAVPPTAAFTALGLIPPGTIDVVVLIVAPVGVYLTPTSFSFSAAGVPLLTMPGCAPVVGAGAGLVVGRDGWLSPLPPPVTTGGGVSLVTATGGCLILPLSTPRFLSPPPLGPFEPILMFLQLMKA